MDGCGWLSTAQHPRGSAGADRPISKYEPGSITDQEELKGKGKTKQEKKIDLEKCPFPAAVSGKATRWALTLLGFAALHGAHCTRRILMGLRFPHFQIRLKKF